MSSESATFFSVGWEQAFHWRASRLGPLSPQEQKRFEKATRRMDISFKRENEQRIANGKELLWDGSIATFLDAVDPEGRFK